MGTKKVKKQSVEREKSEKTRQNFQVHAVLSTFGPSKGKDTHCRLAILQTEAANKDQRENSSHTSSLANIVCVYVCVCVCAVLHSDGC